VLAVSAAIVLWVWNYKRRPLNWLLHNSDSYYDKFSFDLRLLCTSNTPLWKQKACGAFIVSLLDLSDVF
jgi:hypothetical protein